MKINLNLFVHGVPKGQKIWGPQENDRNFIESFYGRKGNVEVQLLIDIIQTSGHIDCYYTYIRYGNILDKDNRPGGYFALTVRCNAYYNDLVNMYNILDAAYHKFVLGTILKSETSVNKFIVQDFDLVDKQLQDLDKEIMHYIELFSNDSDFIELDGFKSNSEYKASNINLLDCNSTSLLAHVKANGNLSVSPLYPTSQIAELTRKKDEEITNIKSQSQQQITKVQDEAKKERQAVQQKKEDEIKAIKGKYASIDKTIEDLKKANTDLNMELKNEKQNVTKLKDKENSIREKLNNYDSIKNKLDSKIQELENVNQTINDIKKSFSDLSGLAEALGMTIYQKQVKTIEIKKTGWLNLLNKFHPLIDLIIMLALAFALTDSALRSPTKDIEKADKKIEQLQNELQNKKDQLTESQNQLQNTKDQLTESQNQLSKLTSEGER